MGRGFVGSSGGSGGGSSAAPVYDTYANIIATASPTAGREAISTDGGGRWIYDGTIWRPQLTGPLGAWIGRAPPAASGWTWLNQGTSTLTDDKGKLKLTTQSGSTSAFRGIYRTLQGTAASAYVRGKGHTAGAQAYDAASDPGGGVMMRESATGKLARMTIDASSSTTPGNDVGVLLICGWGTDSSSSAGFAYQLVSADVALRLVISSGNLLFQTAANPDLGWTTVHSVALTTPFTTAPNQVGWTSLSYFDPGTTTQWIADWEQGDVGGPTATQ